MTATEPQVITTIPAGTYAFMDAMHLDDDAAVIRLSTGADGGYAVLRVSDSDPLDATEIARDGTDVAEMALVPSDATAGRNRIVLAADTPLLRTAHGYVFGPYRMPTSGDELVIGWCAADGHRLISSERIIVYPGLPGFTRRIVQAWMGTHPRPAGAVAWVAYPDYRGLSARLIAELQDAIADSYAAAWETMSA